MRTFVLTALVSLAAAAPARAGNKESARREYEEGAAHMSAGRYREAIAAFERSYLAVDHPNTLFNIAECHSALGETDKACEYYGRVAEDADNPVLARKARDALAALGSRCPRQAPPAVAPVAAPAAPPPPSPVAPPPAAPPPAPAASPPEEPEAEVSGHGTWRDGTFEIIPFLGAGNISTEDEDDDVYDTGAVLGVSFGAGVSELVSLHGHILGHVPSLSDEVPDDVSSTLMALGFAPLFHLVRGDAAHLVIAPVVGWFSQKIEGDADEGIDVTVTYKGYYFGAFAALYFRAGDTLWLGPQLHWVRGTIGEECLNIAGEEDCSDDIDDEEDNPGFLSVSLGAAF